MLFPGPDSVLSPDWLYPVPVTILSSCRSPYFVRPAFVLPCIDSILVLFRPARPCPGSNTVCSLCHGSLAHGCTSHPRLRYHHCRCHHGRAAFQAGVLPYRLSPERGQPPRIAPLKHRYKMSDKLSRLGCKLVLGAVRGPWQLITITHDSTAGSAAAAEVTAAAWLGGCSAVPVAETASN